MQLTTVKCIFVAQNTLRLIRKINKEVYFMLRQVALDTETTGKSEDGTPGDHCIIEIGCVEIIDRKLTGRVYQVYLNPERDIDEEATKVHGMTWEQLKDQPKFKDICVEFIDFIRGSELLIHNAKFDTAFMDKEFSLLGLNEKTQDIATVTDTIALARQLHPNHQVSLDNLCNLFGVSNKHRVQHGALLDAQLLAEVYLAMTGGQTDFELTIDQNTGSFNKWKRPNGCKLKVMSVEQARHAMHIDTMFDLAQKSKMGTQDEVVMAGSHWGPQFTMPYLEKGKEEGKKDYQKRLSAQKQELIATLLSSAELQALNKLKEEDQKAYEHWEDRVQGKIPT